jgi:FixJ family two-component response regulator
MIFIVDDDGSVRSSLVRLLRSAGFAAEAFGSAEDFLRDAHLDGASCVIIDVHMPGMNGLELQQELVRRPDVPRIVMITAYDDPETRRKVLEAGAAMFLRKPFNEAALLSAVSTAAAAPQSGP